MVVLPIVVAKSSHGGNGELYIDPGTGSLIIQAIIAALITIPVIFRNAIRSGVGRLRRSSKTDHPEVDPPA
ncbi:MAG TPA: hypothetical protein VFW92_08660 [Candidatus Limnocylindrales bacterium]|jgi:hypothetical protein|nr:hypothetical protein [Candidatus Limnocylindrales bacterium]